MPRWWIFVLVLLTAGRRAQTPASDLAIQTELRDRLAKSVIGKDGFTPRVKDGVVYWEGSTTVAQHKGAATRMAKSAGARRVVNNIRVVKGKQPAPAPVPKAAPKAGSAASPAPAAPVPPPVAPPASAPVMKRLRVEWKPIPVH
jgi:hypothetical protein